MAEDTRRLIPMSIKKIEDNLWSIEIDGGESYKIEGDFDSIKKALRRIKGKDGETKGKCRSSKVGTYASMLGEDDNELHKINVWKSKVPHSADEFRKLMENKNMKSITLTKNYLIEGNIIPKGTIVEFKEKLDFLPTDIWEQAQAIEDEHERFEFIKSELNKLGDDYSDDEIEDFINKYKTELNESKKKITKEDVSDMLFVIEDTLKTEKEIDIDTKEDILEKAEKNKELLDAWDNLMKADDKSFNKKENKFWEIYDKFITQFKLKNKNVA
jgi:hypothetical protein